MASDRILAALALACAGCAASTPEALACGGVRPPFDACLSGATWAACGGSADAPVFACSPGGAAYRPSCRWFAGGCVPEGFTASACPADALCCVDDHPFDADTRRTLYASHALFLHMWGSTPRSRASDRNLLVDLAPLEPVESPSLLCDEALEAQRNPCWPSPWHLTLSDGGEVSVTTVATDNRSILGWVLVVEVTRDADGALHASACHVQTTDYDSGRCETGLGSPDCASSGTLTLDAFPATDEEARTTRMQLHAVLAGGVIDLRF